MSCQIEAWRWSRPSSRAWRVSRLSRSRDRRTVGIILIVFGAVVLALVDDTVPDRSRLIAVSTGKGWGPSAIRFTLTTDPRHFHYLSKAGHIADVWGALETAGRSELGVLIDPTSSHSP